MHQLTTRCINLGLKSRTMKMLEVEIVTLYFLTFAITVVKILPGISVCEEHTRCTTSDNNYLQLPKPIVLCTALARDAGHI